MTLPIAAPVRLCRVCAAPLPPHVRQGRPPVVCGDVCRAADKAADQSTRRATLKAAAAADAASGGRPPRDPANAAADAETALATLAAIYPLARRICELVYGFHDGEVEYHDDEVAELLNADPTIEDHFDETLVRRDRTLALETMRGALDRTGANPGPFRAAPDDEPVRIVVKASGRRRQSTPFDDLCAAFEDDDADAPLPFGEVTVTPTGTKWRDADIIPRAADPAAEWLRKTHGDAALVGFPTALRGGSTAKPGRLAA